MIAIDNLILTVIFVITLATFMFIEYRQFKTVVTPFFLFGLPYLILVPLTNIILAPRVFYQVSDLSMLLFLLYLLIFFLAGILPKIISKRRNSGRKEISLIRDVLESNHGLITFLYIAGLVCYTINLIQVIRIYGVNDTKSHGFGIFAHIGFLSRVLYPCIFYYCITYKNRIDILLLIINTFELIAFQGKYHIFIPIIESFILYLLLDAKHKLTKWTGLAIIIGLIGYAVFLMVYTVVPLLLNGRFTIEAAASSAVFINRQFLTYLIGPLVSSNTFFQNPCYAGIDSGLQVLFNPLQHLFENLLGNQEYFSPVIMLWATIDNIGTSVNVGGIVSETVVNIGYIPAFLYVIMLGLIIYIFYFSLRNRGRFILTTITLLSMLFLGFFCNYFTLYANFECIMISVLIDILLRHNNDRAHSAGSKFVQVRIKGINPVLRK